MVNEQLKNQTRGKIAQYYCLVIFSYIVIFTLFFSPVLFSGKLLAPGDGIVQSLPAYYSLKTLWTTLIFGGYPIAADPQNMTWYPLVRLLSLVGNSWNVFVILAYVLASSFTFGFVYTLTKSWIAGFISGLVFGMSGFFMAHLGHTNMIHAAAWLPAILLCLEKMKESKFYSFWLGATSLAVAMCFLAGHPQTFVYSLGLCGLYILITGWKVHARFRYYVFSFGAIILGIFLTSIQLLPSVELAKFSVRESLSFQDFISYSLQPRMLVMILFPYIFGSWSGQSFYGIPYFGPWGLAELTGYIGLLPLVLALFGAGLNRKNLQIWFWGVIAFLSLLLALGGYTPLAKLMYHLPGFNLFRVPARHFLELSLSVSILAGYGVAAIRQPLDLNKRLWLYRSTIIVLGLVILCFLSILLFQNELKAVAQVKSGIKNLSVLPWKNPAVGLPLLIVVINSVMLFCFFKISSKIRLILLTVLLVFDLGSSGWFCEWKYQGPSSSLLNNDQRREKYKSELYLTNERMLPVRGVLGSPEEIPPNLSRLWEVPSISGYNPLILTRASKLLDMHGRGEVSNNLIFSENESLNLLATRYLFIPQRKINPQNDLVKNNFCWLREDIDLDLGSMGSNSNVNQTQVDIFVPAYFATKVALVTSLSCSANINDHTRVLQALITTADGKTLSFPLMAGQDTSEWAWERSDVKPIVKHKRAQVFESFVAHDDNAATFEGHRYITVLQLGGRYQIEKIKFEWIPQLTEKNVAIALHKISFLDDKTNMSFPVSAINSALSDKNHWRHVEDFGETAVYENLRAMPRTWLVPQVISLKPEQILKAIQTSFLPSGGTFNPHQMALVEEPLGFQVSQPDPFTKAMVVKEKQTSIELVTSSVTPSFLVLSDVNYPGWKATIDGQPVHIFQTNYLLRGIVVPAGGHTVRFEFHPKSFYLGAGISILSAIFLIGLGILSWKKKQK